MRTLRPLAIGVLGLVGLGLLPQCGSSNSTAEADCEAYLAALCKKRSDCSLEDQTQCQVMSAPLYNCANAATTCPTGKTYNAVNAHGCPTDYANLSCADATAIASDPTKAPTSCQHICQ